MTLLYDIGAVGCAGAAVFFMVSGLFVPGFILIAFAFAFAFPLILGS